MIGAGKSVPSKLTAGKQVADEDEDDDDESVN
jgi:hypothetical protein